MDTFEKCMLQDTKAQVQILMIHSFTMFITALRVILQHDIVNTYSEFYIYIGADVEFFYLLFFFFLGK